MLTSTVSFLRHLGGDHSHRWDPILAVYYLTYRCRFACPYCSDGVGTPYYRLRAPELPANRVLELLGIVRKYTEHLVLTGGEPLEHHDLGAVLSGLPALRFESVTFTTNGYELERHWPLVRGAVTNLVLSLDTLDNAKADAWYGFGPGTLARILETHERVRADPARRCDVIVSTVLTPNNLDDAPQVYEYAKERDFQFSASPQLIGVKVHPALDADERYHAFYERLIAEKRKGARIHGTRPYLEAMRDLAPFHCRPFTMLTVSPEGNVMYPCLELGHIAGNLLEIPDLTALRREGERKYGPPPRCPTQCHSPCALGFATALDKPFASIEEGYWAAQRALRRALGASSR